MWKIGFIVCMYVFIYSSNNIFEMTGYIHWGAGLSWLLFPSSGLTHKLDKKNK